MGTKISDMNTYRQLKPRLDPYGDLVEVSASDKGGFASVQAEARAVAITGAPHRYIVNIGTSIEDDGTAVTAAVAFIDLNELYAQEPSLDSYYDAETGNWIIPNMAIALLSTSVAFNLVIREDVSTVGYTTWTRAIQGTIMQAGDPYDAYFTCVGSDGTAVTTPAILGDTSALVTSCPRPYAMSVLDSYLMIRFAVPGETPIPENWIVQGYMDVAVFGYAYSNV